MPGASTSTTSTTQQRGSYTLPLLMICLLFFVFGFITWANGTLIPFFKLSFSLSNTQAFFVTFASYIAYFVLAIPSSWILKKVGFKNGLSLGLLILAIGSLLFIPAAKSQSFPLFLIGIFIQGASLALLQTASNPYLTIIGPIESAAKRISMAGICNKGAGILVPIIMGTIFLKNSAEMEAKINAAIGDEKTQLIHEVLSRVNTPYIVLAIVFTLLAILFKVVHLPEVEEEDEVVDIESSSSRKTSIFQFPHLFLGALCIFVYVAAEVMAGDIIGVYGRELNLDPNITKYLTSLTLACMLIGYITGIITIPKIISQQKALRICAVLGIILSILTFASKGHFNVNIHFSIFKYTLDIHGIMYYSVIFIALLGLANSLMWPAIFPLGIQGLGKFTKIGSAIMIMGIAGGAIWPLFYGFLQEKVGLHFQSAYFIAIVPCYLYILYFAIAGHKVGIKKH